MTVYTTRKTGARSYDVFRDATRVGSLDLHANGYADWTFTAGRPIPSRTTQARLLRAVREQQSGE